MRNNIIDVYVNGNKAKETTGLEEIINVIRSENAEQGKKIIENFRKEHGWSTEEMLSAVNNFKRLFM